MQHPRTLDAFRVATECRELAGTLHRETFWLVADHLGTPRMVVYKTGSLTGVKRHDYLPFGEELGVNAGGRTAGQGYGGNDNVRQKLVMNERDAETALDFFKARYYSAAQGRFTSIDPGAVTLTTPQGLNRYQNCLNHPLRYADPDGLYNKDVHYNLTRLLALAAGFSDAVAEAVATSNQKVDTDPIKNPYGYYGRKRHHFTSPERRQKNFEKFAASGSTDDLSCKGGQPRGWPFRFFYVMLLRSRLTIARNELHSGECSTGRCLRLSRRAFAAIQLPVA